MEPSSKSTRRNLTIAAATAALAASVAVTWPIGVQGLGFRV